MPDETNPAAAPVVAPVAAPVTPAAKPAEPVKSASEKLHERAAALLAKKDEPAEPAKPVEAKVDIDPDTLKKLTEASERTRAATKRADDEKRKREEIEASQSDVLALREAQRLYKAGDKAAALAKLAGVEDPSAEMEDLLQRWLKTPPKDGEIKLTAEEIAAIKAENEENKKFRESEQARQKAENDRKAAGDFSVHMRDSKDEAGAPRWPLAAAPENAVEAAAVAIEKASSKLLKLGSPTVTRELAEHLFELAYAEIEANLAKAVPAPSPVVDPPARTVTRAAVVPRAGAVPATKPTYARTPDGARQKLIDAAKALTEKKGLSWS